MLVSVTTYYVMLGISIALTVISLLVVAKLSDWLSGASKRRAQVGGAILLAVSLACALAVGFLHTKVFVVVDGAGGRPEVRKLVLIYSATYHGTRAKVALHREHGDSWLINDSQRPVHVDEYRYSTVSIPRFGERPRHDIAPGGVQLVDGEVEYFGPGDAPPRSIQTKSSNETRWWLSW